MLFEPSAVEWPPERIAMEQLFLLSVLIASETISAVVGVNTHLGLRIAVPAI
jgi:hypothetical protein